MLFNLIWIYKIKKKFKLHNGKFIMISYCDNPYYINNFCIKNCKNQKENLVWFFRNVNRDLVRQ